MRGGPFAFASSLLLACGAFTGRTSDDAPSPVAAVDGGALVDATGDASGGGDGGPPDACANHACDLLIFVSSVRFDGALPGGFAGANEKCQELATAANLPNARRFRAFLAKVVVDADAAAPPALISPNRAYARPDGAPIGNGKAILGGTLQTAVEVDEKKKTVTSDYVWTNVETNGLVQPDNCTDWQRSDGLGSVGLARAKDGQWAAHTQTRVCNESLPIYCVEATQD